MHNVVYLFVLLQYIHNRLPAELDFYCCKLAICYVLCFSHHISYPEQEEWAVLISLSFVRVYTNKHRTILCQSSTEVKCTIPVLAKANVNLKRQTMRVWFITIILLA